MSFKIEYLDLVLVPSGLLIMFAYHLFLLHRYLNRPHKTAMGFENFYREIWTRTREDVNTALTVISSNITAATTLASVALTLCPLIDAWLGGNVNTVFTSDLIYGDTRPATVFLKNICLLICFLLAFSCFVQSARHFVHANYLISTPDNGNAVEEVTKAVIRGGDFWSLGLRALYFALNLLLWFFGPIPMFVCSAVMVFLFHFLDSNTKPVPQRHNIEENSHLRTSLIV
ncbi:hypothetical protein SLEP1_g38544 [Rubroshorea leprosula]|nr:hypothetical protein SLEP1_g38544 [Rubroshorea leprosula]